MILFSDPFNLLSAVESDLVALIRSGDGKLLEVTLARH